MTAREVISQLELLNKEAGMYSDAIDYAISILEEKVWKEEHPVSPLHDKAPLKDDSCIDCNERMICNKYLNWLNDPKDIFIPKVDGCKKFNNDIN